VVENTTYFMSHEMKRKKRQDLIIPFKTITPITYGPPLGLSTTSGINPLRQVPLVDIAAIM
jgi:hypothetical protein